MKNDSLLMNISLHKGDKMRKKISDINMFTSFNVENEYYKLKALFEEQKIAGKILYTGAHTKPSLSIVTLSIIILKMTLSNNHVSIDKYWQFCYN